MSKFFKGLKSAKKAAATAPPRSMDEIQQEYGKLVSQAGQNQYQTYVLGEDLKRINAALLDVNQEAAARQALDKQVEAANGAEESVKSGAV